MKTKNNNTRKSYAEQKEDARAEIMNFLDWLKDNSASIFEKMAYIVEAPKARKTTRTEEAEPAPAEPAADTAAQEEPATDTTAAPEGLQLVEIAGGVAIVGTADNEKGRARQTYRARREIKAHGARWNREAARWEATDPADVARLRAWFALRNEEQTNAPAVLFTLDGEDYKQGDRVTIQEVNDGQVTTECGTLADYASGQALAEIQTDNGRTVYGFYGSVKHITEDTLQQAEEISDTTNEPAETLPEWATECARVTIMRHGKQMSGYITEIHKAFRGGRYVCTFNELDTLFSISVSVSDCAPVEEPAADAEPEAAPVTDTEAVPDAEPAAPAAEPAEAPEAGQLSPLLEAVTDFLGTCARVIEEAKKWEGVTVPAEVLQQWKTDTATGAKSAAERFAEVCACLASLTPEARTDFDALGVIFWTLGAQLRNGGDPATVGPATDYARRQLFDLIDRTQTAAQAAALRRATYPESMAAA